MGPHRQVMALVADGYIERGDIDKVVRVYEKYGTDPVDAMDKLGLWRSKASRARFTLKYRLYIKRGY